MASTRESFTRNRSKLDRIERLRTRLEQVKLASSSPGIRPLIGILNGVLDLLADEL